MKIYTVVKEEIWNAYDYSRSDCYSGVIVNVLGAYRSLKEVAVAIHTDIIVQYRHNWNTQDWNWERFDDTKTLSEDIADGEVWIGEGSYDGATNIGYIIKEVVL